MARENATGDIKIRNTNARDELLLADFSSLGSVRSLVREFSESHGALHVLVNNAGVAEVRRSVTIDGFENHLRSRLPFSLSPYQSAESHEKERAIPHRERHLRGSLRRAKLAQVLFTYELARRLEGTGVTANCLHPGAVATNIWGRSLGPFSFLGNVTKLFLVSPERGAETSVYLASSPEVRGGRGNTMIRCGTRNLRQIRTMSRLLGGSEPKAKRLCGAIPRTGLPRTEPSPLSRLRARISTLSTHEL